MEFGIGGVACASCAIHASPAVHASPAIHASHHARMRSATAAACTSGQPATPHSHPRPVPRPTSPRHTRLALAAARSTACMSHCEPAAAAGAIPRPRPNTAKISVPIDQSSQRALLQRHPSVRNASSRLHSPSTLLTWSASRPYLLICSPGSCGSVVQQNDLAESAKPCSRNPCALIIIPHLSTYLRVMAVRPDGTSGAAPTCCCSHTLLCHALPHHSRVHIAAIAAPAHSVHPKGCPSPFVRYPLRRPRGKAKPPPPNITPSQIKSRERLT